MTSTSSGVPSAQRFQALWQRCGGRNDVTSVHAALCARYSEPHRRYHTLDHVSHCLLEFDSAPVPAAAAAAVEMTLWFHDVIYRPGAPDNEQRSADAFSAFARGALADDFIAEVCRLIAATTHVAPPADEVAAWVVDVDLSSFGLPWDRFLVDSRAVREEQAEQDDAHFYPAQSRFLRGLCARPRIYLTAHFHDRYEQQARANIGRLLDAIAGGYTL